MFLFWELTGYFHQTCKNNSHLLSSHNVEVMQQIHKLQLIITLKNKKSKTDFVSFSFSDISQYAAIMENRWLDFGHATFKTELTFHLTWIVTQQTNGSTLTIPHTHFYIFCTSTAESDGSSDSASRISEDSWICPNTPITLRVSSDLLVWRLYEQTLSYLL